MTAQLLSQIGPSFLQALSQGYNVRNAIDWLIKNNKSASKQIKEALKQGYSYDDIGEYLTKGKSRSYSQQNAMLAGMTEKEKSERIANYVSPTEKAITSRLPQIAAGTALAAIAPMALRYAVPSAIQPSAILPVLPQQAQIGLQHQQTRGLPHFGPKAPVNAQQPPPPQAPIQPTQPAAAVAPTPPQQPATQILNNLPNIKTRVDTLREAGNTADVISGTIKKLISPEEKNALKQVNEPLESIVNRYLAENTQQGKPETREEQITPPQPLETPKEEIKETPIQTNEKPKEIKPKETVILPSGEVGEVKATNNKNAIVNVNGKDQQVKVDEIDSLPVPKQTLDKIYDDLIAKIQEEGNDVSKSVFMTAYDAPSNELVVWYLNGDVYRFDDIPEDKAKELQQYQERRTSGVSINGPWEKGTKSVIGSRMFDLIEEIKESKGLKGLKKEDKEKLAAEGKETTPHARKYGIVYNTVEPAWKAKQEKMKAEQEEKRRKKKEEKEKNAKQKRKGSA